MGEEMKSVYFIYIDFCLGGFVELFVYDVFWDCVVGEYYIVWLFNFL